VLAEVPLDAGTSPPLSRADGNSALRVETLFRERFEYSLTNRLNPVRVTEYLTLETPGARMEELAADDAEHALLSGLRLALRERFVRPTLIGGFFKDMFGGMEERHNLRSPFRTDEGVLGWNGALRRHHGWKAGVRPIRDDPYVYVSYGRGVWWSEERWQTNLRLYYEEWHIPGAEFISVVPLGRGCSLDTGVQFRDKVEPNGNFFARGGDQKFSTFVGFSAKFKRGGLYLGASGLTPRGVGSFSWSW
jgi:hypothetical protein